MTNTFDPVPFVQRQLDAYNARDLDRFVREYTDDITAWRLPGAQPLLSGKDERAPFLAEVAPERLPVFA